MSALEFQQTNLVRLRDSDTQYTIALQNTCFTYSAIKTANLTNQVMLSMYVSINLIAEFKLTVVCFCKQAWKQPK